MRFLTLLLLSGGGHTGANVMASLQPEIFLAAHASFFDLDNKRGRVQREGVQAFVDPQGYQQANAAKQAFFEAQLAQEQSAK